MVEISKISRYIPQFVKKHISRFKDYYASEITSTLNQSRIPLHTWLFERSARMIANSHEHMVYFESLLSEWRIERYEFDIIFFLYELFTHNCMTQVSHEHISNLNRFWQDVTNIELIKLGFTSTDPSINSFNDFHHKYNWYLSDDMKL